MGYSTCSGCQRQIRNVEDHAGNCPQGDGPEIPDNAEQLDRIELKVDKALRLLRKLLKKEK